jgi:hypothetical protein
MENTPALTPAPILSSQDILTFTPATRTGASIATGHTGMVVRGCRMTETTITIEITIGTATPMGMAAIGTIATITGVID